MTLSCSLSAIATLYAASQRGHIDTAKLLVSRSASIDKCRDAIILL